jgi:hypothetical protein
MVFWSLSVTASQTNFYAANNLKVKFIGRIDFSNPFLPKMWASGTYMQLKFKGNSFSIQLNDEFLWGKVNNYLSVQIDNQPSFRLKLANKENLIQLASNLSDGVHLITIVKDTEFENGYIEIVGFECEKLLTFKDHSTRKIEFIGDSITCGAASDEQAIPCGKGDWHDQHNAFLAYGPRTATALNAQWHLSAVSGIGLMHSCCDKKIVMPQVFDKVNMAKDSILWNFKLFQPDVVTICLGQNDGIQDSTIFVNAYLKFVKTLRIHYPKSTFILLTSPMAHQSLKDALNVRNNAVLRSLQNDGEHNIATFSFKNSYQKGCGSHPSIAEHQEIAKELTGFIKQKMKWK